MRDILPNNGPRVDLENATLSTSISRDLHYLAIASVYGEKAAARSGVPLINHIKEGLYILDAIAADLVTKQAYCLHPIFQGDAALGSVKPEFVENLNPWAIVLVVEYRNIANRYLSTRAISSISDIALSPLPQVQAMLVADKIQNRKDFDAHHKGTHPRSNDLDRYFQNWFDRLGVSEEFYNRMVREFTEGRHLSM